MRSTLLILILAAGCGSEESPAEPTAEPGERHPALLEPRLADETAPEKFRVRFETTKGSFVVEADRSWAPKGVDRFYNLVRIGYFDGVVFFRVIRGFMAQFGIHGDPEVTRVWNTYGVADDPAIGRSNQPGVVTFAQMSQPNSRSVQLFINTGNNRNLDAKFPPIAKVVEGMDTVYKLDSRYGENPPKLQENLAQRGNAWLMQRFPELDSIRTARLVE